MDQRRYGIRKAEVITCYLDESGTDESSPTAVVGGLLLHRRSFLDFNPKWKALLKKHGLPSIHIKEFQSHGKLAHFSHEQRESIFSDAANLINHYKSISVGATLSTAQYKQHFANLFEKSVMSFYGMCFILAVVLNHRAAENSGHKKLIPFLMDEGNAYVQHVRDAHATARQFQRNHFLNLGSLSFRDDRQVIPLQAADVVAWSVRRRLTKKFTGGFEPLQRILDSNHVEAPFGADYMRELTDGLNEAMRDKLNP